MNLNEIHEERLARISKTWELGVSSHRDAELGSAESLQFALDLVFQIISCRENGKAIIADLEKTAHNYIVSAALAKAGV